jgi:outer membrane protein assembly factor BamB
MVEQRRRRLLRALGAGAGVGAAGVLAGCGDVTGVCNEPTPEPAPSLPVDVGTLDVAAQWPMVHRDAANTGSVPPAGPTVDVVRRWRANPDLGGAGEAWVVAAGDRAYVAGRGGGAVAALDATDGSVVWRYESVQDTGALAVAPGAGLVLVCDAGGLQAVDVENGERAWGTNGPALDATDVVLVDGKTAYVAGRESILAVDVERGEVAWSVPGTQLGAVADGRVVAGEGVRALDAGDGSKVWALADVTPSQPVTVAGGSVYVGEVGHVTAYALSDGTRQWRYRGGTEGFGVPVITGDRVTVGTVMTEAHGGNVYTVARDGGGRQWCNDLGSRDLTVVGGDGVAYLAGGDMLAARRVADGEPIWTHQDGSREYERLAVAEGALLAAAHGGVVEGFGERS